MNNRPIPISLSSLLGASALSDDELASLRHKAWTEQGLLIVHPWDRKLTPSEAALVRNIGERIYGGNA